MTEITKERRDELALKLRSANSIPVCDTRIKAEDLKGLLDMADERDQLREIRWKHLDLIGTLQDCVASTSQERDRYRVLLEKARPYLKAHGWNLHHKADRGEDRYGHVYGDQAWSLLTDIDATLEDKE